MITLWRNKPPINILNQKKPFPLKYVFPSARQALSHSLKVAQLGRKNRVAYPEWSSQCVINAIGKYCSPIPTEEVVENKIKIDALLIYEQWGWPISVKILERLNQNYKNTTLVLDMVDSADYFLRQQLINNLSKPFYQIISLSKLLGLSGGGLLIHNNQYIAFQSDKTMEKILSCWQKNDFNNNVISLIAAHIAKSEFPYLNLQLKEWLEKNDLFDSVEKERVKRQNNLKVICGAGLTHNWPQWMKLAIKHGAGPNIAPLLRKKSNIILNRARNILKDKWKIETAIYHFNWSGDPLDSLYEKCLAFPIHGQVKPNQTMLNDIIQNDYGYFTSGKKSKGI